MATRRAQCPHCAHKFEIDPARDPHVECPACGQGLTLPPGLVAAPENGAPGPSTLAGEVLGDYEVLEFLGRGAMGAVYKARQASLDRLVALKVLEADISADERFIQRFTREARAAAAVSHPNIIEVFAVGQEQGRQYIAMEFVDGESLSARLHREGRLAPDRAVAILKQVASALAKAHAAGICHRDIKPANLLLTADGRAKIADFGVARRGADDDPHAGLVVGTALYLPPELAAGRPADFRSDLYSLGATFYHLLAGRPPYEGKTAIALVVKHAQGGFAPLEEVAPGVPLALCRVIQRLMLREPDDRYASATDLLAALDRIDQPVPVAAVRPPTSRRPAIRAATTAARPPARPASRNLPIILGTVAGLLALGLVGVLIVRSREPRETGSIPPTTIVAPDTKAPPPIHGPPKTDVAPPKNKPPRWAKALADTAKKADRLARDDRFDAAIAAYEALLERYPGADALKTDVDRATGQLRRGADDACRSRERQARDLMRQKQFDAARAALKPVAGGYGIPSVQERLAALAIEIGEAETRHNAEVARAKAEEARKAVEAAEREKRRLAEGDFARAVQPIDGQLRKWQFEAAAEALAKIEVGHESLTARLETRRDQVERLRKLKGAMIARIASANPRLTKRDLLVPGINGEVVGADKLVIHATQPTGRAETHPWASLSPRTLEKLLGLVVDGEKAADAVGAGLLCMACGRAADAEPYFAKARALGADVERYRDPLAAAAYARAVALLGDGRFDAAGKALADLETRFGKTPWFAAHTDDVAAARRRAAGSKRDLEAMKLYAAAAAFYQAKQLFELKPIIAQLQKHFADTAVVTDAARKPSVAEMAAAVAKLAEMVTVAQDGSGQHVTIQKAIDAAKAGGAVVILDSAIYAERLNVPQGKKGLTIQGKPGQWPIISFRADSMRRVRRLIDIDSPDVTLERIVLALHKLDQSSSSSYLGCIANNRNNVTLRSCVLYCEGRYSRIGGTSTSSSSSSTAGRIAADHCIFALHGYTGSPIDAANCIWLDYYLRADGYSRNKSTFTNCVLHRVLAYTPCEFRRSTVTGRLDFRRAPSTLLDSIVNKVNADEAGLTLDYCDVFGKPGYSEFATPGLHCFSKNPQFIDAANFDFRLKSTSPCRGKASDNGDVGARYTRQMVAMLKLAHDLRRRGIIRFIPFTDWQKGWLDSY